MIRIDYLNKNNEPRHIFLNDNCDDENLGNDIKSIMNNGATDIYIYRANKIIL